MKRKNFLKKLNNYPPEYFIILTLLFFFAIIKVTQILLQIDLYPVNKIYLGFDFNDFYRAAQEIINERNPYNIERYVTPPYFAMLLSLFCNFNFSTLMYLFFTFNIIFLLVIIFILINEFQIKDKIIFSISYILITMISFPYLFLIDRGNIDLVILFLLTLMLVYFNKNEYLSGVFLGISILIKLYPILLLIPLWVLNKKKIILITLILLLVSILLHFNLWKFYFENRLLTRALSIELFENASVLSVFIALGKFAELFGVKSQNFFLFLGLTFYFVFLSINLFYDKKFSNRLTEEDKKIVIIKYFVFLVQLPIVVFQYEFVILFVFLPYLRFFWENKEKFRYKNEVIYSSLALALTFFPTIEIFKILDNINLFNISYNVSKIAFVFPSLGLIFLTVYLTEFSKNYYFNKAKNNT